MCHDTVFQFKQVKKNIPGSGYSKYWRVLADLFTKCFESYLADTVLYTTVIFCAGLCILGYCCAAELTYMCCLCMWAVGGGGGHTRHTFVNIDLSICRDAASRNVKQLSRVPSPAIYCCWCTVAVAGGWSRMRVSCWALSTTVSRLWSGNCWTGTSNPTPSR